MLFWLFSVVLPPKYTKKGRAIDPSILLYAKVNGKVNLPLP